MDLPHHPPTAPIDFLDLIVEGFELGWGFDIDRGGDFLRSTQRTEYFNVLVALLFDRMLLGQIIEADHCH